MAIKRRIDTVDTQARRTFFGESDFDEIEYQYGGEIEDLVRRLDFATSEAKKEMDTAYQKAMRGFEAEKHSLEDIVRRQEEVMQKLCGMGIHLYFEDSDHQKTLGHYDIARNFKRCLWCEKIVEVESHPYAHGYLDDGPSPTTSSYSNNPEEFTEAIDIVFYAKPYFGCNKATFNLADSFSYEYLKAYLSHQSKFTFDSNRDSFEVFLDKSLRKHRFCVPEFYLSHLQNHQEKPIPEEAKPLLEELYEVLSEKKETIEVIAEEEEKMEDFRRSYLERLKRMHIPLDEEEET